MIRRRTHFVDAAHRRGDAGAEVASGLWSRVGRQLNWRAAAASVSEPDCTRSIRRRLLLCGVVGAEGAVRGARSRRARHLQSRAAVEEAHARLRDGASACASSDSVIFAASVAARRDSRVHPVRAIQPPSHPGNGASRTAGLQYRSRNYRYPPPHPATAVLKSSAAVQRLRVPLLMRLTAKCCSSSRRRWRSCSARRRARRRGALQSSRSSRSRRRRRWRSRRGCGPPVRCSSEQASSSRAR